MQDIIERGRTMQMVVDRLGPVLKPMHLEFIEPTKRYADLIIPQGGENEKAIGCVLTSYTISISIWNKTGCFMKVRISEFGWKSASGYAENA